jgi:tyrosine-protein kinase Etk/Wzc
MVNLSTFLWKTEGGTDRTLPPPNTRTDNGGMAVELSRIAVEQVEIRADSHIVLHTHPRGPGADRFRYLRMQLRELWKLGGLRRLVITSPKPNDGKSTVALNLATALAEGGKRSVLLIDADLYQGSIAHAVGLDALPGLAECLEEGIEPLDALRRLEPLHWYLLPAGTPKGNPTELLQADLFTRLIHKLTPSFDWILMDSPPVVPLADALSLSHHADATLLVVRADQTPKQSIEDALERLGPKHQPLAIILNGAEGLHRLYTDYYGHYDKKRGAIENNRRDLAPPDK